MATATAHIATSTSGSLNLFGDIEMKVLEKDDTRISKMMVTKSKNFQARKQRIRERFDELHNDRRIRYDDVMQTLSLEFCLSQTTILKALKSE